ncbi:hypothetical protein T492DRAFT_517296 [Pavlovales sp. CCMP2436]|nr:hypothetical protein T492DRAFT_517296 [Pavlovales sp. CCMP2436]
MRALANLASLEVDRAMAHFVAPGVRLTVPIGHGMPPREFSGGDASGGDELASAESPDLERRAYPDFGGSGRPSGDLGGSDPPDFDALLEHASGLQLLVTAALEPGWESAGSGSRSESAGTARLKTGSRSAAAEAAAEQNEFQANALHALANLCFRADVRTYILRNHIESLAEVAQRAKSPTVRTAAIRSLAICGAWRELEAKLTRTASVNRHAGIRILAIDGGGTRGVVSALPPPFKKNETRTHTHTSTEQNPPPISEVHTHAQHTSTPGCPAPSLPPDLFLHL